MRKLLILPLLLWLPSLHAAIVAVSNTGQAESSLYSGEVNATTWRADNFTSGENWQLSAVALLLGDRIAAGGNFFVELWSSDGGGPDTHLLTLAGNSDPATAGLYTYVGSIALAADTDYYILAGVSAGSGSYDWTNANGYAIDAASRPNWAIPGDATAVTNNAGTSWDEGGSFPMRFAVYGEPAAAPLPSTALLLGPALASLRVGRRRRRHA